MTLPKSGKITLSEIVVNFKPSDNSAEHAISEYYRGSNNVSDTINNNNIPKQGRVAWSDYWGAGLQDQYDFQIPELCTNSFHSFCRGVDGWYDLQDLPKEYVGRDDTSGSIAIPVYHPQASIEIPSMEFEIGSELGGDTQFERVYFNQVTNENVFKPGNWTLEIPKKFKRLRIVATGGGAGGSVQKNLLSGDPIKNKMTKGTVESGNAGEITEVWTTDFKVSVPGATAGEILDSEISVFGGIDTTLSHKLANSPTEFNYTDVKDEKIFKFENIFENNNFPVNMVYRDIIGMVGNKHNELSPNGVGGTSLYSAGEIPFPEMKISTNNEQLVLARAKLELLTIWVSAVNNEVLSHNNNKVADGTFFANYVSTYGSYGFLGLSAKQFAGEDSSGNEIFQTHPQLIDEVRNTRAEVISLESTATIDRNGVSAGVDDSMNLWAGASETITLPSTVGAGAGGRAGQHGGRGSDSDWTTTRGGNAAMTAYLGDFETTPGDIINIKVGAGGGREYNQYNEYFSDINSIAKTWSVSGRGGDGSVQLFGSHGRLHSSLTHAGWILEDDLGNVIGRGYTAATSHKGNTNFQNAKTAEKYFEVIGTVNPEEPRMYYLRFSARISKNGDFSLKNRLCHIGQKHVKVTGLSKTIFSNPPSLGSLFITPDTAKDVEDVKGSTSIASQTDAEIINNWFIEKCNVTFTTTRSAAFTNTAKFTKVPSTDEGVGPDSITFGPGAGTQSFVIAKHEVYVLNVSNLNGSGRRSGHPIYSYVRDKTQMQLEDKSSSPDAWSIADLGITISGLCGGGWYVQGALTYFSGSYTGSSFGKGTRRAHNKPPPPPPPPRYVPKPIRHSSGGEGNNRYQRAPIRSVRVGNTWHNTYAYGPKTGYRNHTDIHGRRVDAYNRPISGGGGGGGGGGKIVCTEMYRQTQLNDWKKTIKIWDVYQKRHLTPYHEIGYHWLFRPYVNGMKKSNTLTKLGAYLAKRRTQHLKHVLTKGKSPDNIIGNIWCKICHPTVYITGKLLNYLKKKDI